MGQGHYMALGFGALDVTCLLGEDDVKLDAYFCAIDRAARRRVHHSFESRREYLAILVAENAGVDDLAVVPTTCLLADGAKGPAWTRAKKAWERVRKASAKLGVELPEGQPLLIVDYD